MFETVAILFFKQSRKNKALVYETGARHSVLCSVVQIWPWHLPLQPSISLCVKEMVGKVLVKALLKLSFPFLYPPRGTEGSSLGKETGYWN